MTFQPERRNKVFYYYCVIRSWDAAEYRFAHCKRNVGVNVPHSAMLQQAWFLFCSLITKLHFSIQNWELAVINCKEG